MPPEPGRFSTTTGCPRYSDNFCASTRAVTSVPPPAENPTITRTGFNGYVCAAAVHASSEAPATHPLIDNLTAPSMATLRIY